MPVSCHDLASYSFLIPFTGVESFVAWSFMEILEIYIRACICFHDSAQVISDIERVAAFLAIG